jgi:phosphatidate phosphatase LPIN
VQRDFPMKLGEGGEAFFVFETSDVIPPGLQTSPLVSPETSPLPRPTEDTPSISLPEPEPLDLASLGSSIERPKSVDGESKTLLLLVVNS